MGGTAERLKKLGLVDEVLKEPHGGGASRSAGHGGDHEAKHGQALGGAVQSTDHSSCWTRARPACADSARSATGSRAGASARPCCAPVLEDTAGRRHRAGGGLERRRGLGLPADARSARRRVLACPAAARRAHRSRLAGGRRRAARVLRQRCAGGSRCRSPSSSVAVETAAGVSVEAAARDARYRALCARTAAGRMPVDRASREDQAETLLLQLLRGAGLKGMSAMPLCRPFAAGWHLRPLLDVTRSASCCEFGARTASSGSTIR